MKRRLVAVNITRAVTVAKAVRRADTVWTRLVGLLRHKHLPLDEGLWIVPCNSIHSFAMKFVFDAVFLDRELRVVHLQPEMSPWRVSTIVLAAHSVLELSSGTIARTGTGLGDQFRMDPSAEV